MRKNANQEGSTTPSTEPRDGEKEAAQRISLEIAPDGNVTDEIGTAELEAYLAHLAHLDIPLRVKNDLIRALHRIMQSFVDRAFGDDPAQLACESIDNPSKTDGRSDG